MMIWLSRLWHWLLQFIRNLDSGSEWAAYTIIGMVGLWGILLVFPIFVDDPPYLEVVDRGQLFLYSVGFLMSSLYLVQRDWTTTFLPHRTGLRTAMHFRINSVDAYVCVGNFGFHHQRFESSGRGDGDHRSDSTCNFIG